MIRSAPGEPRLGLGAVVLSGWLAAMYARAAVVGLSYPDLLSATAYDVAHDLLPWKVWAAVWATAAVLWARAALTGSRAAVRAAVVVSAPTQLVFAWSILYLSVTGTPSAIIGADQWLAVAVVQVVMLLPSERIREALAREVRP